MVITIIIAMLPRVDNFFVLIIFAANSCPLLFCIHRLTMENAPLKKQRNNEYEYTFFLYRM